MSFLFSNEFLNEIRNRINVSDIVGRTVKLRRAGSEYEGLCPFHNEKTPSFTVNDQKGFYHCFGCGAHGDVIKFMVEAKGYKFLDAVEELAKEAGLTLPKREQKNRKTKEQLDQVEQIYRALECACDFFQEQLKSSDLALSYVKSRNISDDSLHRFRIGYAPQNSNEQINYLKSKGFSIEIMEKAGLLSISSSDEKQNNFYAKFRGRLMFPIMDNKGRVIAFGGRVLSSEDKPKYLNSPDTEVFHKGYNLYAQHLAKEGLREKLSLPSPVPASQGSDIPMPFIICEGYTDVISLYQKGFKATVAPLGTAVTEDQIRIIWRFSSKPIFCLDGDNAGYRAALRVCERAVPIIKAGQNINFIFLPQGEDPDTYIEKFGVEMFMRLLTNAKIDIFELLWKGIYYKHNKGQSVSDTSLIRKAVKEIMEKVSDKSIEESLSTFFKSKLFDMERSLFKKGSGRKINNNGKSKSQKTISSIAGNNNQNNDSENYFAQKVLLIAAIKYPEIIDAYHLEFSGINFDFADLSDIHQMVCDIYDDGDASQIESIIKEKTELFTDKYGEMLRIDKLNWLKDSNIHNIKKNWKIAYDKTIYLRDLKKELLAAQQEYEKSSSPEVLAKIDALYNIIREIEEKEGELFLCNKKEV